MSLSPFGLGENAYFPCGLLNTFKLYAILIELALRVQKNIVMKQKRKKSEKVYISLLKDMWRPVLG